MKTRQAFYLHTTKLTRIARRLCREILRPWHAARHPYLPINSAAIKAECECVLPRPVALSPPEGGKAGAQGVLARPPLHGAHTAWPHRCGPAARSLPEPTGAEAGRAEALGGRAPVSW